MRLLTDFRRDIALGIRLLARYRGFSAVSVATLALAIGGSTAVFTIVNALLLTPPPVAEPARLARVDTGQSLTSWPNYEEIRDRNSVFAGVAASRLASLELETGGTITRLTGQITSPNYLSILGVPAELGRTYASNGHGLRPRGPRPPHLAPALRIRSTSGRTNRGDWWPNVRSHRCDAGRISRTCTAGCPVRLLASRQSSH